MSAMENQGLKPQAGWGAKPLRQSIAENQAESTRKAAGQGLRPGFGRPAAAPRLRADNPALTGDSGERKIAPPAQEDFMNRSPRPREVPAHLAEPDNELHFPR